MRDLSILATEIPFLELKWPKKNNQVIKIKINIPFVHTIQLVWTWFTGKISVHQTHALESRHTLL